MSLNPNLDKSNVFLTDLARRRGRSYAGSNPYQFVEKFEGGHIVEVTAFEPDPTTYRHEYYYNSVVNRLYKKNVTARNKQTGLIRAFWQGVSD